MFTAVSGVVTIQNSYPGIHRGDELVTTLLGAMRLTILST